MTKLEKLSAQGESPCALRGRRIGRNNLDVSSDYIYYFILLANLMGSRLVSQISAICTTSLTAS